MNTKNNRRNLVLTIIGAVLVIALAAGISGCAMHRSHAMSKKAMHEMMLTVVGEKLDLSDDQKTELKKIISEVETEMKSRAPEHEKMKGYLSSLIRSETLDTEQLNIQIEEHFMSNREHRMWMLEKIGRFHKILTAEQKEKLITSFEEFHKEL